MQEVLEDHMRRYKCMTPITINQISPETFSELNTNKSKSHSLRFSITELPEIEKDLVHEFISGHPKKSIDLNIQQLYS